MGIRKIDSALFNLASKILNNKTLEIKTALFYRPDIDENPQVVFCVSLSFAAPFLPHSEVYIDHIDPIRFLRSDFSDQ